MAERNNKNLPAANQKLNESPKTVSENPTTNRAVRDVSKENEKPVRPDDSKRAFLANPAKNENYQNPSFPQQPGWRQLKREEKREARQELKQNRREIFVEKVKQMPPERRNKIRNILQRRRN